MPIDLENATAVAEPQRSPVVPASRRDPPQRDDLAQIIETYNAVTERLQRSHDQLGREVMRLQHELAGKNAQLQRSKRLAALGEMAAGIAHEVRNPLAAIHLYARMVVEDMGRFVAEDGGYRFREPAATAGRIAEAVRGLDAIVNDVLSFARELHPVKRPCSAAELFSQVLEAHRPAIDAARIEVRRGAGLHGDKAPAIHADPALLHRAMLNVVRNAVDAMAGGDGQQRILTVDARGNQGQHVLVIRDSGPGIAPDAVDRIFNPFFTTRNTGTGLGLAIVHRIVDAHGGVIVVYNDDGAVFELCLPAGGGRDGAE